MARRPKKRAIGFRMAVGTLEHLKRRAEQVGTAQTALAERYIDQGLRMDEHPLIFFREGELGRRAALLGTRLDVADVVTTIRQNDNSVDEAARYLELPVEQVEACVRYYADYKPEVDELIERAQAAAEHEQDRRRREREALV